MSRLAAIGLALACATLLSGCDSCPYTVDSISATARSTARFDVANATLAEHAWSDLGFATTRDGLQVHATKGDVEVYMSLDSGGTVAFVQDHLDKRDFRVYGEAQFYVAEHRAASAQRINETLAGFEAKVDWPAFVLDEPAQGSISTC
jgi:hypothetical protein